MSIRVLTTLCELEKTLDRLQTYQRDEAGYPLIMSTIAIALEQLRQIVGALYDDVGHVEHIARRADRREIPASLGGRR